MNYTNKKICNILDIVIVLFSIIFLPFLYQQTSMPFIPSVDASRMILFILILSPYFFVKVIKNIWLLKKIPLWTSVSLIIFFLILPNLFNDFGNIISLYRSSVIYFPLLRSLTQICQLLLWLLFSMYLTIILSKINILKIIKMYCTLMTVISLLMFIFFIVLVSLGQPYSDFFHNYFNFDFYKIRVHASFGEPSIFGMHLLLSLILIPLTFKNFNFRFIVIGLHLFNIIISYSRSVWLALFFVILSYIVLFRNNALLLIKKYGSLILLLLFFSSFALLSVNSSRQIISSVISDRIVGIFIKSDSVWSSIDRLTTFTFAIEAFKQSPIIGIGHENFIFFNKIYLYYLGRDNKEVVFPEVNNLYIKLLAEMGVVGVLLSIWFLATLVKMYFVIMRKGTAELVNITKRIAIFFTGTMIFFIFFSQINLFLFWFVFSLFNGIYLKSSMSSA